MPAIDAPEKAQPFGLRSQHNLGTLAVGRDVKVEWNKRDRYGRVVGSVGPAGQLPDVPDDP